MKPLLFSVSRKGYDRDEVNAFLAITRMNQAIDMFMK